MFESVVKWVLGDGYVDNAIPPVLVSVFLSAVARTAQDGLVFFWGYTVEWPSY